jgi:hypothetical protein
MPLSPPVSRKHIHTREIRCQGFQRDDGLWDIEGRIVDTKTYSFSNEDRGTIAAGVPVHEMLVRLTVDTDLVVQDAEASTEAGPFTMCGDIAPQIKKLIGFRITSGWTKNVREALGGAMGCTHINHLLIGPLATTAIQALIGERARENPDPEKRPRFLDTCHALAADSPVVKREWPQFYEGA